MANGRGFNKVAKEIRVLIKIFSATGTRTPVSCVRGKYDNHLHHGGDAPAENRTRGPTMATLDFTTKPLVLLFSLGILLKYKAYYYGINVGISLFPLSFILLV